MIYYDNKEFDTEQKYEVYILNKYLTKKYGKQNSRKLILSNANNLDKLAVALAQDDISFFCLYFLTNFFVQNSNSTNIRDLADVHYEIFEELNNMFVKDRWDNEEFILPRGLGKSTVINKALACWTHCYKRSRYTVVIGKREEDAVNFVEDTKQMLKTQKIVKNFGELVNTKDRVVNKQEVELDNKTKSVAIS